MSSQGIQPMSQPGSLTPGGFTSQNNSTPNPMWGSSGQPLSSNYYGQQTPLWQPWGQPQQSMLSAMPDRMRALNATDATQQPQTSTMPQTTPATGPNTSGMPSWYNFKFQGQNLTPEQQNFNYLAGIDPKLAFSYVWQGGMNQNHLYGADDPGFANSFQRAIDAQYGQGIGSLTNAAFTPGGFEPGSPQAQGSGLGANYLPQNYFTTPGQQIGAGGTFNYGGQQYTLPNYTQTLMGKVDPNAYIQQYMGGNPYFTGGLQSSGIGGEDWMAAVKKMQGG